MKKVIKFLCLNALLIGGASLGMDVNPIDQGKALCDAADAGNLEQVKALLDAGAPVDTKDEGGTPLTSAACYGHIEICQLLLEHNAQVDTKNDAGYTPLIYNGHLKVCQLLLGRKAQIDAKNNEGSTPLMKAAAPFGRTAICSLLIDATIKQIDKTAAITLLGMRKFNRATCMNGMDRNVIQLIARQVVDAETKQLFEQIDATKYEGLFAQIDAITNKSMRATLRTYAEQQLKLKMDQKTNNGDSHE